MYWIKVFRVQRAHTEWNDAAFMGAARDAEYRVRGQRRDWWGHCEGELWRYSFCN